MRSSDPRLRAQLAPASRQLAGVIAAGVVSSLLIIAQAWVVTGLILAVVHGGAVTGWGIAAVVVLGMRGVSGWAGDVLASWAAAVVGTALRRRFVDAVVEQRPDSSSGELAILATRGVSAAEPYLTRYLPALVLAVVLPPLTVLAIAVQDPLSAVIVLLTLPLIPVFGALVGLATRDRAEEQWRELASLSGHFLDVVKGLPTLVAHRRARAQSARIAQITDRYRVATLRTLRLAFASSAVLELVATLSVALVAVTVGVRLAEGHVDLRTALLVLLLAPEAYWPLRRVGAEFHAASEGVATFERLHDLFSQTARAPGPAATGAGAVVADGLSVVHPGRLTPALDHLDAVIAPVGVTVVTGPSGCGKSTLLAILAGLQTATTGSVTVDGVAVGSAAWRGRVAWVAQRPRFVTGSIADNLRLAAPGADDDTLWAALRQVALEGRVQDLPGGLDAALGEDGATLSAGERARLALARVVVARRPWVLLDEPTAHLDELTEQVIADTVVELGRRSAVVVVSHRPALIALADHELALTPSRPVRAGPPEPTEPPSQATISSRTPSTATPVRDEPALAPPAGGSFRVSSVLGSLSSASGVALTATAGWLIVQASGHPAVLTLLVAIVGVRTFGLARPLLRYGERLRSHDAALRLLARRRVEVYDAVVPLTPGRLGRRRGDVLTAIVDDVDCVVDRQLRVLLPIRTYAAVSTAAALVAGAVLPAAGIVVAGSSAVAGIAGYGLARWGAARSERSAVAKRADLSAIVVEIIQTAEDLAMWQLQDAAADRVADASKRLADDARATSTWWGAARAAELLVAGGALAAIAAVAGNGVDHGLVSRPMAALLVLLPLALIDVALPLADAGALSVRARVAAERLRRLEHTAPAVRDTVSVDMPSSRELEIHEAAGRWEPGAPLSRPATFTLRPGARIAVVGPSGCGKSTLAALLVRFLDPSVGDIGLGGVSTRYLALDDVRRMVGLVDDDPHVFASTLVENVRLARPDATDAEVEVALRSAHLGDWLDTLPDGLDTWVGDGHACVSGGERARLGIARSLLADQPILILDEPAAHLDHATAIELARDILGERDHRAVVWITHDHVGLDLVDQVVDLGDTSTRSLVW